MVNIPDSVNGKEHHTEYVNPCWLKPMQNMDLHLGLGKPKTCVNKQWTYGLYDMTKEAMFLTKRTSQSSWDGMLYLLI